MSSNELRKSFTIIPQDPTLFSGSVRFNLDPEMKSSEQEIWESLTLLGLRDYVNNLEGGLDLVLSPQKPIFSWGQCQLLSFARAILSKRKIIILDEVTSSLDSIPSHSRYNTPGLCRKNCDSDCT
eukprot:TRINITY_DN8629_c0_g1_i2.p1 TRINITY_DN8629_c0_g1~~TRINITY_DN8629_c0_g1_i2.p1  ORF type:complete len:125 (-),score=9.56 TRINITY_DN8629_c0_g1_i2:361-735(-)